MGRILAIDYGKKRVGLAVTDPLHLFATSIGTVQTNDVFIFIDNYLQNEQVDAFVVGEPRTLMNEPSESHEITGAFVSKLQKKHPSIPIHRVDERFTSKIAFQTMIDGGLKKKDRQNKALVDSISATLILQTFLSQESFNKQNAR